MKQIKIADVTLREGASGAKFPLSFKEKLELARELDRLGVDVIETAPIINEKTDALLIRTIAGLIKNSVLACPVGMTEESVGEAWKAVSGAASPRLVVSLPVSTTQMEYVCGCKPAQMLERIKTLVGAAAGFCKDVEFSAEDATRADPAFLYSAVEAAVAAGAKTVTVCDSAANMFPDEFAAFITGICENAPSVSNAALGVQCSDELGMAISCSVASIGRGAGQIKSTVSSASFASMEAIARVLEARGDALGVRCSLDMIGLGRSLRRMAWLVNPEHGKGSAFDAAAGRADSSDFTLDESADIYKVGSAVTQMGYELSAEDMQRVFEAFSRIAAKKKVNMRELETIVASAAFQVPATYKLTSYVINSGNIIAPTASIRMEKEGKKLEGLSTGDGPIDAAFLAVEQITGRHFELDEFQIQAVTEGREAMGSALVRLRSDGKVYPGQGVSTDIIGAAIRAYTDALNKIMYEEKNA